MIDESKSALPFPSARARVSRALAIGIEAVLLVAVVLSPWAFGSAEGIFEFALICSISSLLGLWACRLLIEGQLRWSWCPASLALVLLFVQGSFQLIPLPSTVLQKISPRTAEFYRDLLPEAHEVLPAGQTLASQSPPPGTTLSVYPAATKQLLLRLLAVMAVFVVVRHNIEPAGGLRRLAIVATSNAVALSIVALLQSYTSRSDMVYWTFASPGAAFGPFVNRNHFSFYANVCFSLGFGLLLSQLRILGPHSSGEQDVRHGQRSRQWPRQPPNRLPSWVLLLQRPVVLWLCVGLAWILSASLLSLSRGGLLALCGAFFLWLILQIACSGNVARVLPIAGIILVFVAGSLGLAGMHQLEQRYSTTLQTEAPEARLSLWRNCLRVAPHFLTMGSGFGTFRFIEQTSRDSAEAVGLYYEHAHNEYLEALIEGGLPRFLLLLVIVVAPFYAGVRLSRLGAGKADLGLVVGALLGLGTMALHSFAEFGLHVPAITLLVTIVTAHLLTLWKQKPSDLAMNRTSNLAGAGWGSALAAILGAVGVAAVAFVLVDSGFRNLKCQACIFAALQERAKENQRDKQLELQYLCLAESLNPESGVIDNQIGATLEDMYDGAVYDFERIDDVLGPITVLSEPQLLYGPIAHTMQILARVVNADSTWQVQRAKLVEKQQRDYLDPAFRYFVQARDRCPLEPKNHVRLARLSQYLPEIDAQDVYLRRAKQLAAYNPELWFTCGVLELRAGQKAESLNSLNQSARLSNDFLDDILLLAKDHFTPAEIAEQLFGADPKRLGNLIEWRKSDETLKKWRGEILCAAEESIRSRATSLSPEERHMYALILSSSGHEEEAFQQLQRAIGEAPEQIAWSVDLANFFVKRRMFEEARHILIRVLADDAKNARAQELLRNLPQQR